MKNHYFKDPLEQRKYEILGILRTGEVNPKRMDGGWNLEGFLLHFGIEQDLTAQALEYLMNNNGIYLDGLGLFHRVALRSKERTINERSSSTC